MVIAMLFGAFFREHILTVTFIAGTGFEHAKSPPWVYLVTGFGYWVIYPFCTPLYKIAYFMILALFVSFPLIWRKARKEFQWVWQGY